MSGRGIIYRKDLDQFELCFFGPVCQQFQIIEFTNSERILTAKTEYRYRYPRPFPATVRQMYKAVMTNGKFFGITVSQQSSAGPFFKPYKAFIFCIINSIFIGNIKSFSWEVKFYTPPVFTRI